MFLTRHFFKRIMRDGSKSLSVPLIALVLVVLINLLGGVRQQLEAEYLDAIENYPILVRLSDHSGENIDDLNIREFVINQFASADHPLSLYEYTSDLSLRRTLTIVDIAGLEADGEDADNMLASSLIGITNAGVLYPIEEDIDVIITFFGGYDESVFTTSERVFVISEDLLPYVTDNKLDISYRSNNQAVPVAALMATIDITLDIVGTVSGIEHQTILAPFWTVSEIGHESDNSDIYSQLLHMTVADNRELSGLKSKASDTFARVRPVFSILPFSMTIYDSSFFETLEPLRQNIILVDVATPFIYIISVALGFLTCILLTRRRLSEYAIMRSVGVHRRNIFVAALGEQAILSLIGASLGLALVSFAWVYTSFVRPAVFLACYILGAVFSVTRAVGSDVMAILRTKE